MASIAVSLLPCGRDVDNGQLAVDLLDLLKHIEPVRARQQHIQQQHVGRNAARTCAMPSSAVSAVKTAISVFSNPRSISRKTQRSSSITNTRGMKNLQTERTREKPCQPSSAARTSIAPTNLTQTFEHRSLEVDSAIQIPHHQHHIVQFSIAIANEIGQAERRK